VFLLTTGLALLLLTSGFFCIIWFCLIFVILSDFFSRRKARCSSSQLPSRKRKVNYSFVFGQQLITENSPRNLWVRFAGGCPSENHSFDTESSASRERFWFFLKDNPDNGAIIRQNATNRRLCEVCHTFFLCTLCHSYSQKSFDLDHPTPTPTHTHTHTHTHNTHTHSLTHTHTHNTHTHSHTLTQFNFLYHSLLSLLSRNSLHVIEKRKLQLIYVFFHLKEVCLLRLLRTQKFTGICKLARTSH
jgi:hypothetical protein